MSVSEKTYRQVALEDPDGMWELANGRLRSKPDMSIGHNRVMELLTRELMRQLPAKAYAIRMNTGRVHVSTGTYFIPDVWVVPAEESERRYRENPNRLEVYDEAMPLVVEVWSPSTGDYDVEEKLREYQRRGDLEIWRIHPYERTLTRWVRQGDGKYEMSLVDSGTVHPEELAGVTIDLEELFE
jgi:Uma2 family endonuclease